MKTPNLTLVPHEPSHLLALLESTQQYETCSSRRVAEGVREMLLAAAPDFFERLQKATGPDPWNFGFAVIEPNDNIVIGMGGFTGPPDMNRAVEIGYGIAPAYQGRGLATEVAQALVEFAGTNGATKVCANTLRETNASTRVLEKCGFKKVADDIDPEGHLTWRWERQGMTASQPSPS